MALNNQRFTACSLIPGIGDMEVIFRFIQPGFRELPALSMYDLIVDIPKHPAGSTISRITLEECGYKLPKHAP